MRNNLGEKKIEKIVQYCLLDKKMARKVMRMIRRKREKGEIKKDKKVLN